jgi:hypothetical protein
MDAPNEATVALHLGEEVVQTLTSGGSKWSIHRWTTVARAAYLGMSYTEAAGLAEIARETLVRWRQYPGHQESWDYWVSQGTCDLATTCSQVALAAEDSGAMALRLLERRSKSFRPPAKQIEVSTSSEHPPAIRLLYGDGTVPEPPVGQDEELEYPSPVAP